jgi:hypothetical protein
MAPEIQQIKQGHIDLSRFGDWHENCDFVTHPDPWSGFSPVYAVDRERYFNITEIAIARNIPESLEHYLSQQFAFLSDKVYAAHLIPAGKILPWHQDAYRIYCEKRAITDLSLITRVIIFVQDWKVGHGLQVGDRSIGTWQRGDWVSWQGDTPHLVYNLGQDPRYTLQITGTKMSNNLDHDLNIL